MSKANKALNLVKCGVNELAKEDQQDNTQDLNIINVHRQKLTTKNK